MLFFVFMLESYKFFLSIPEDLRLASPYKNSLSPFLTNKSDLLPIFLRCSCCFLCSCFLVDELRDVISLLDRTTIWVCFLFLRNTNIPVTCELPWFHKLNVYNILPNVHHDISLTQIRSTKKSTLFDFVQVYKAQKKCRFLHYFCCSSTGPRQNQEHLQLTYDNK